MHAVKLTSTAQLIDARTRLTADEVRPKKNSPSPDPRRSPPFLPARASLWQAKRNKNRPTYRALRLSRAFCVRTSHDDSGKRIERSITMRPTFARIYNAHAQTT